MEEFKIRTLLLGFTRIGEFKKVIQANGGVQNSYAAIRIHTDRRVHENDSACLCQETLVLG